MKFFRDSSKWLSIIGLILVWISVSYIFGFITYISLFVLLLLIQVILISSSNIQIKKNQRRVIVIGGLVVLIGIVSFIIAFFIEVPIWYKIFLLIAQGAFAYAEIKMLIEARTSKNRLTK
ncbi:hypothetical protein BSK49_25180 [Paenibacillus odorifer]|jgi:hypothetical protein|uniref:DUF308 domain-containing protein n=1 Tax=Paenibacillus odorifer TaxID=189426 RepID=A0ABX3GCG0_9BACL|nr:hypothetical protein [Paenibacillus odorifer]OMC97736.1 hypothetical protein BSO21_33280 [Paenibacillus odorifer]OMD82819.1 hypothetical protein BSK49_25180 [Paenibacillus odorifer]